MRFLLLFLLAALLGAPAFGQLLLEHVNLVDIENRKINPDQYVLVADGRIRTVSAKRPAKLPSDVESIDGGGKFLIPGFIDAHVHFFQSGGLYARPDAIDLRKIRPYSDEINWVHTNMEDLLRRYTAAGITGVVDVGSTFPFLVQRDSFANKPYAPVIAMTGPLLTTYVPPVYKDLEADNPFMLMSSEKAVRDGVRKLIDGGADFVKIWYIALGANKDSAARKSLPLVKLAIDEAHRQQKIVAVHATERITAELAVEAGADFLVHNIDDEVVSANFIQLLKQHKVVLCPTMVVADNYPKVLGDKYKFSERDLRYANPYTVGTILDYPWPDTALAKMYIANIASPFITQRYKTQDSILQENLRLLHEGGVTIATGTDAGNTGTQHIASYFDELEAMQKAGFSNWDLLQSSTVNAAKAVRQDSMGSIAPGKLANMILLNSNPVDDLNNWRDIDIVINKGNVFRPDSILQPDPEQVVQRQLNAYNAHNLAAFLETYAKDIQVYNLPDQQIVNGIDQLRENYGFVEKTPGLYCRILNRMVEGNNVIDHEEIWIDGKVVMHGLVLYQVENGKIKKVFFTQ